MQKPLIPRGRVWATLCWPVCFIALCPNRQWHWWDSHGFTSGPGHPLESSCEWERDVRKTACKLRWGARGDRGTIPAPQWHIYNSLGRFGQKDLKQCWMIRNSETVREWTGLQDTFLPDIGGFPRMQCTMQIEESLWLTARAVLGARGWFPEAIIHEPTCIKHDRFPLTGGLRWLAEHSATH